MCVCVCVCVCCVVWCVVIVFQNRTEEEMPEARDTGRESNFC